MTRKELDKWERNHESGNIFYVYVHTDPETGVPFYVGKGTDGRAWSYNLTGRSYQHARKLKELMDNGHPIGSWVSILHMDLSSKEALRLETETMHRFLNEGAILLNITIPSLS